MEEALRTVSGAYSELLYASGSVPRRVHIGSCFQVDAEEAGIGRGGMGTGGDARMQLPRHCRVSPPAPTYTTNTTNTNTQAGASPTARSLSLSLSLSWSQARSRSPGNSRAEDESSLGFIYRCRATWAPSSEYIYLMSARSYRPLPLRVGFCRPQL